MNERHVGLKKAYELIIGNKVFSDKKKINCYGRIKEDRRKLQNRSFNKKN